MHDRISTYFKDGRSGNYCQWAQLIAKEAYSSKEIVIIGKEAQDLNKELQQHYLPNILFQISEKASELPLLINRFFEKKTLIYVCEKKVCKQPVKTVEEALMLLKN